MKFRMLKKINFSNSKLEVNLNYSNVDPEIANLLKKLYNQNLLKVLQTGKTGFHALLEASYTDHNSSPILRSNFNDPSNKPNISKYQYILSSLDALTLIWHSAIHFKEAREQKQLEEEVLTFQRLREDFYIKNPEKIYEILSILEKKLNKLKTRGQKETKRALLGQEKIKQVRYITHLLELKMKQMEANIQKLKHRPPLNPRFYNLQELTQDQKQTITRFLLKKIVKYDKILMQKSIFYLEPYGQSQIIVHLEQSYPPFILNQSKGLQLLQEHYDIGFKNFEQMKIQSQKENVAFDPNSFYFCHNCQEIKLKSSQRKAFNCRAKNYNNIDYTTSPIAYEEILFNCNYNTLGYVFKNKANCQSYEHYFHPYALSYGKQCNRYLCGDCCDSIKSRDKKIKDQQVEKQSRSSTKIQCKFCDCLCECERCNLLEEICKLIAIYHIHGGKFAPLISAMIFLNYKNQDLAIKEVQQKNLVIKEKVSLHEHSDGSRQSRSNFQDRKRRRVTKDESQNTPLIDQNPKMAEKMKQQKQKQQKTILIGSKKQIKIEMKEILKGDKNALGETFERKEEEPVNQYYPKLSQLFQQILIKEQLQRKTTKRLKDIQTSEKFDQKYSTSNSPNDSAIGVPGNNISAQLYSQKDEFKLKKLAQNFKDKRKQIINLSKKTGKKVQECSKNKQLNEPTILNGKSAHLERREVAKQINFSQILEKNKETTQLYFSSEESNN